MERFKMKENSYFKCVPGILKWWMEKYDGVGCSDGGDKSKNNSSVTEQSD